MRSVLRLSSFPVLAVAALCAAGCMPDVPGNGNVVHDQPTPHDLLTASDRVEVRADVDGDLIAAGSGVVISGPIAGYAIAAGRHVAVREEIGNDLIAAGETVDIQAPVDDRVLAAGRSVRIHPGVEIGGAAYLAGNTVSIEGDIGEFVQVGAQEVRISGRVGGRVEADAARVSVLPGATIEGDLVVESREPPEVSPQADVRGTVEHRLPERDGGDGALGWAATWLFYATGLFVLGAVIVALSPAWAGRVGATLAGRPGLSFGAGVLALIVTPIVIAVLLVTVIGIPLGMLMTALYIAALLLAAVFVAYRLGGWIFELFDRRDAAPYLRMLVGAIVLGLAMSLPFVGGLVALVALMLGLGALLLERRSARDLPRGAEL